MPVSKTRTLTFPGGKRSLLSGLRHERFRLIAFETRDPSDPTSPRREASLFDSPGLLARRFFSGRFFRVSCARLEPCGLRSCARSSAIIEVDQRPDARL